MGLKTTQSDVNKATFPPTGTVHVNSSMYGFGKINPLTYTRPDNDSNYLNGMTSYSVKLYIPPPSINSIKKWLDFTRSQTSLITRV